MLNIKDEELRSKLERVCINTLMSSRQSYRQLPALIEPYRIPIKKVIVGSQIRTDIHQMANYSQNI